MYSYRDTISSVKDRASIIDIVSRYVQGIKKRGSNYLALCPFHNEKTPSFNISEEKKLYHCFGCGKSGDIFRFIIEIENVDFVTAVKKVAEYANISLPEKFSRGGAWQGKKTDKTSKNERQKTIIKEAGNYFVKNYRRYKEQTDSKENPEQYLLHRGIVKDQLFEIEKNFNIGFADERWDGLLSHLIKLQYTAEDLLEIGLISQSKKGRYFDRFRKRLIFPIQNEFGDLVGFGGRVVNDDDQPKYLNSSESEVFHKKEIAYGLFQGKKEIQNSQRIFLMEGYLDVIAAHIHGIVNSISILGTAFGHDHVRLLQRYSKQLFLVFDADKAGSNAALRAAQLLRNSQLEVKIISLPNGMDPFDYFLLHDKIDFMATVGKAVELKFYEINHALTNFSGKLAYEESLRIVSSYQSFRDREELIKYVAKRFALAIHTIEEDLKRQRGLVFMEDGKPLKTESSGKADLGIQKLQQNAQQERYARLNRLMHQIILMLLIFPSLVEKAIMDFSLDSFRNHLDRLVLMRISEAHLEGDIVSTDILYSAGLPEKQIGEIFAELIKMEASSSKNLEENYSLLSLQAKKLIVEEKITVIQQRITEANDDSESEELQTAFEHLAILNNERDRIAMQLSQI